MCLRTPYSGIGTPPYEEPPQQSPYISAAHQFDKIKRARANGRLRRHAPSLLAPVLLPVPEAVDPEARQLDVFMREHRKAMAEYQNRGARLPNSQGVGMNAARRELDSLAMELARVDAEIAVSRVHPSIASLSLRRMPSVI